MYVPEYVANARDLVNSMNNSNIYWNTVEQMLHQGFTKQLHMKYSHSSSVSFLLLLMFRLLQEQNEHASTRRWCAREFLPSRCTKILTQQRSYFFLMLLLLVVVLFHSVFLLQEKNQHVHQKMMHQCFTKQQYKFSHSSTLQFLLFHIVWLARVESACMLCQERM